MELNMIPEIPALYEIARTINHKYGFDWTDPRTGKTYKAPKKKKKVKRKKK